MNRLVRHAALASVTALTIAAALVGPAEARWYRVSLWSAYLCLALYCWALTIGPIRVLRRRPHSLNVYLRRDIGIWAALTGLVHLVVGTEVSMNTAYFESFVAGSVGLGTEVLRRQLFIWGSLAGFVVGLVFLLLLALSSNRAIHLLGPSWWKRLQRSSYLAFFLLLLHGVAFQALELRAWPGVGIMLLGCAAVIVVQVRGARAFVDQAEVLSVRDY
jgi:sulfoxide reductase heme-binding subunit YedZ